MVSSSIRVYAFKGRFPWRITQEFRPLLLIGLSGRSLNTQDAYTQLSNISIDGRKLMWSASSCKYAIIISNSSSRVPSRNAAMDTWCHKSQLEHPSLSHWEWMRNWHTQKQLCSNQLIHWYLMEDQHKQQTPRGNSKDRGAGQCNLYAKSMVKVKRWEQGNKKRCLIYTTGSKDGLYSFVINGLLYYGWFIIITVLYPLTLFLFTIHELHDQYLFKL